MPAPHALPTPSAPRGRRHRRTGALAVAVAVATALLTLAAPAAATPASLQVTPTAVPAGGAVTVSGGCEANSTGFVLSSAFVRDATHQFGGLGAVAFTTGSAGTFVTHPVIARSTAPGSYAVTARCGGGNLGVEAHVTVTAATGGTPSASLAVTPATVAAGRAVTVSGSCEANSTGFVVSSAFLRDATHQFGGLGAVAFTTGSAGTFVTHPVIARSTAPGSYAVTARCGGGNLGVAARVTVVAARTQPPRSVPAGSGGLAATPDGRPAGALVLGGTGVLLVAAAGAVQVHRRRTRGGPR